jgi:DNA-binding NarL/FixJ family response regulator
MLRVLIADDHAIVRKGLKQLLLEEYPFAIIEEVEDAESLVAKVTTCEWEVVVCDLSMPGRSGLEALEQIKESCPDLPVLIMSIYPEEQYALRVLKAGASGYLNKGSIHKELVPAIQTVKLGKKFITPAIAEILAESLNANMGEKHELLSNRELNVFKLLASGKSISEIAEQLSLGTTTISTYRSRILEKMQMHNNADLTRYAIEKNLI